MNKGLYFLIVLVLIGSGCVGSESKITLDLEKCQPESIEINEGATLSFHEADVLTYSYLLVNPQNISSPVAESQSDGFNHLTFNFKGGAQLLIEKEGRTCIFYVVIK